MAVESWSPADMDGRSWLVYGPRLGRFYRLSAAEASDARFNGLIGLPAARRVADLTDPADRVLRTRADFKTGEPAAPARALRWGYRLASLSRHVVPLRAAAKLTRWMARFSRWRRPQDAVTPSQIGALVHALEGGSGAPNCYPRALLSAYLALLSGHACVLAVGTLAPTRLMHVWCSIAAAVPYEPMPEHHLYRPVWTLGLSP